MNIQEVYKWGYSLEKDYKLFKQENEKLKEKIDNLTQDLQNRCDRCVELYNKNEHLKQQNTQIKHKNNQQAKTIDRLIKIITDEHYN